MNMSINPLLNNFKKDGIESAGELLLTKEGATRFLKSLEKTDVSIIAINLWKRVGTELAEEMGGPDYGSLIGQPNAKFVTQKYAKQFVTEFWPNGIERVSFILEND